MLSIALVQLLRHLPASNSEMKSRPDPEGDKDFHVQPKTQRMCIFSLFAPFARLWSRGRLFAVSLANRRDEKIVVNDVNATPSPRNVARPQNVYSGN